jgi:hypothetical protein
MACSVGIATAYELDGQGSIPDRSRRFFPSPHSPDLLWGHLASYPVVNWGSSPEAKAAWGWSRPLMSIQFWGQEWSYTSTPQYTFMGWCLIN